MTLKVQGLAARPALSQSIWARERYCALLEVRVEGRTATYLTGDRFILFHHCPACACHTHWSANPEALAGDLPQEVRDLLATRMGINARLLDGFAMREGVPFVDGRELEVRFFDNAD